MLGKESRERMTAEQRLHAPVSQIRMGESATLLDQDT